MKGREFQIIVTKDNKGNYWYTAKIRSFGIFWRGFWKTLKPMFQPTYDKARALVEPHLKGYNNN